MMQLRMCLIDNTFIQEAKDIRRAKSFTSLNTSSSDKQIFESLSQPSPSPVQSSSQDNLVTTFMQYIKQEPVDPSFSWSHNTNTSLSRSTLSSVDSFSPVNSSFCSVKSEVDDDSQFSHASSSKTDSWLTENELKPECWYSFYVTFGFILMNLIL